MGMEKCTCSDGSTYHSTNCSVTNPCMCDNDCNGDSQMIQNMVAKGMVTTPTPPDVRGERPYERNYEGYANAEGLGGKDCSGCKPCNANTEADGDCMCVDCGHPCEGAGYLCIPNDPDDNVSGGSIRGVRGKSIRGGSSRGGSIRGVRGKSIRGGSSRGGKIRYANFTASVFKQPVIPALVMGMVIGVGLFASYQLTKTLKV